MKLKLLFIAIFSLGLILCSNAQVSETSENKKEDKSTSVRARSSARAYARTAYPTSSGGIYVSTHHADERHTSLMLSKVFQDESVSSSTNFSIEKGQNRVSLRVTGRCVKGEILITIVKPNGDVFQRLNVTPTADISWSSAFSLEGVEDAKNYIGEWTLKIEAKEVEGNYSLKISAH